MLSAATYTLCRENITLNEVSAACDMLLRFANDFEVIYGKGATTINLHYLRHYREMILACGPLWSYSLFAFENNIGEIKKLVCGTTDVLEQISKKNSAAQIKGHRHGDLASDSKELSSPTEIDIRTEYLPVLLRTGII